MYLVNDSVQDLGVSAVMKELLRNNVVDRSCDQHSCGEGGAYARAAV